MYFSRRVPPFCLKVKFKKSVLFTIRRLQAFAKHLLTENTLEAAKGTTSNHKPTSSEGVAVVASGCHPDIHCRFKVKGHMCACGIGLDRHFSLYAGFGITPPTGNRK